MCTQVQTRRFTVPCFGRLLTLLCINTCTSLPFSNFDSVQLKMQVAHMMIAFIYFRHVAWIAPAPIPLPFMQVGAVNVVPSLLKAFLHFLPYFLNRSDSYTTHLLYKSTLLCKIKERSCYSYALHLYKYITSSPVRRSV